jgi:exodeoxyribonuclease VII large subunit
MENQGIALSELIFSLKKKIEQSFSQPQWVVAEINELNENRSGHCYLELVEKSQGNDKLLVKVRATIWAFSYRMIKPYFESVAGEVLKSGMKVLFKVSVVFHELYGFSLNITDIDPSFTLGDFARKKAEIIAKLEKDGVLDINKSLVLPDVIQDIAVISSETAAGFGDFKDQLLNHPSNYRFSVDIYPAVMQGNNTGQSIINALNQIFDAGIAYDAVVIIRGGGAKSELSSFDDYELAYHITQFPIPVITGIGHERDETVCDIVANTKLKTPTAVAEFVIDKAEQVNSALMELSQRIASAATLNLRASVSQLGQNIELLAVYSEKKLHQQEVLLGHVSSNMGKEAKRLLSSNSNLLVRFTEAIAIKANTVLAIQRDYTDKLHRSIPKETARYLGVMENNLNNAERAVKLLSPQEVLKRGYALVKKSGKYHGEVAGFEPNDQLTVELIDGSIEVTVNKKNAIEN